MVLPLFLKNICALKNSIQAQSHFKFELIVADFSDEYPCKYWLTREFMGIHVHIIECDDDPYFNRGKAINIAANNSSGDYLCALDADMLVGVDFWNECKVALDKDLPFFPICYSYSDPEHTTGWWREEGYGMFFVKSEHFLRVSGLPEYKSWGKEDVKFMQSIKSITKKIHRVRVPNYFHQWHPNDIAWKSRFIKSK